MAPRWFKETRAEFIVSVATKREERLKKRVRGGRGGEEGRGERRGEKDVAVVLPPDAIPLQRRKRRLGYGR